MSVRTSRVRGRRSSALMQGLMMNLPIELDANGNPKVIDWSSMVSALGERVDRRDLQQMFDHLMPYGMPNWDAIAELLARGADYIEVRQFAALAMVFVELETLDDVAQFLNTLRQPWISPGENIQFTHSGEIFPLPFNPHTICPRLVDGIAEHIDNTVDAIEATQRGMTIGSKEHDELNPPRRHMIERSVLLSVVGDITPPASGNPPVQRTIIGDLSLGPNSPGGMRLNVSNARFTDHAFLLDGSPGRRIEYGSVGIETINMTPALNGDCGGGAILDITYAHFTARHQFNAVSFIGQSTASLALGAGIASGKGVPETLVAATADTGMSFFSEISGAAQVRRDIATITDHGWLAMYAGRQNLDVVVVYSNSGIQTHLFPTSRTTLEPLDPGAFREKYSWG